MNTKIEKAFNKFIVGGKIDFNKFTVREAKKILNLAEKEILKSLDDLEKLNKRKKELENSLDIIRSTRSKIDEREE